MLRSLISRAIIIAILSLAAVACSQKGAESPVSVVRTMPDHYSRIGVDTLETLTPFLPVQTEIAVFSSYGSIAELIQTAQKWQLTSPEEFEKTLADLGTHYKLNPSKLRSFYDAGFDTSSGIGIALTEGRVVVVAKTLDSDAVLKWFENFSLEEFGRPVSDVSAEDGWTFTHYIAMNKEFATLCQQKDITIMVFDNGNRDDSTLNAAKNLVSAIKNGTTLKINTADYKNRLGNAPIVAVAPNTAKLPDIIPQKLQKEIPLFTTTAGFAISHDDKSLDIRTFAELNAAEKRTQEFKSIFGGKLSPWASPIVNLNPPAGARLLFDPQGLRDFVFSVSSSDVKTTWNNIMGKLNQRLLGMNFEQQVFQNLSGSAWVSLYAINSESLQSSQSTLSKILDMDIAAYLPLNDADLAMRFFGKIAILQKLIPPEIATVETSNGILHASVKLSRKIVHVTYADGLIGVTTASGWDRMRKFYENPNQKPAAGILMDQKNIAAANVASPAAAHAIVSLCGAKCAFLKPFAAKLQNTQANAAIDGDTLSADLHLQFIAGK